MKSIILLILACVLLCQARSQKTIIRFEGANSRQEKFYTVDIEGRKFHPAIAKQTSIPGVKVYEINYLRTGAHDLLVYPINRKTLEGSRRHAIYNNRFQVKDDREVVIIVRQDGQVDFSESELIDKDQKQSEVEGLNQPMSMQQFNNLYAAMKNADNAVDRYAMLKNALDVPGNYFTVFQLNNLLSLIHPEPERLVLAKQSSSHLLEDANAAALLDVFSLQASKDELARHFGIKN